MADGMMRCLSKFLTTPLMELVAIRRCWQKTVKPVGVSRLRERGLRSLHHSAAEKGVISAGFVLFAAVFSVAGIAEELHDPTRPPASLSATGTAPMQLATKSRSAGLQSTIISKSRRAAIIDGKTVELGEKHGNARLVEVNEGSVVLRGAQTQRVLTLFPDVKITQRETTTKKKAAPESGVQPEEISTMPATQDEKLLSLPPKEER